MAIPGYEYAEAPPAAVKAIRRKALGQPLVKNVALRAVTKGGIPTALAAAFGFAPSTATAPAFERDYLKGFSRAAISADTVMLAGEPTLFTRLKDGTIKALWLKPPLAIVIEGNRREEVQAIASGIILRNRN